MMGKGKGNGWVGKVFNFTQKFSSPIILIVYHSKRQFGKSPTTSLWYIYIYIYIYIHIYTYIKKCTFKGWKSEKVWKYMYMFRHLNEAQKRGLVNFKWSKHQKYMSNMTPHFFGNFWTTFIFGPDRAISRAWHVTRVREKVIHYLRIHRTLVK